jgi:hypothetical protein
MTRDDLRRIDEVKEERTGESRHAGDAANSNGQVRRRRGGEGGRQETAIVAGGSEG